MKLLKQYLAKRRLAKLERAASRLGQRSQTVRRARKSAKIAEHLRLLRADIEVQLAAKGKPPVEWKYDAGRHADYHAGAGW